jgi:hypothetical protein
MIAGPAMAEESGKTLYRDILPLFQKYCIECHHTGGVAPQSLETYDLARPWLRESRRMLRERTMPPWVAEAGAEKWRNALLPSDEEVELISTWVKDGAEPGDEADAPAPLDFSAEWRLGEPDLVFQMPEPVSLGKGKPELYRNTIFDPGFAEDTWLRSIELRPDSLNIVRQLTLSAVPPDVAETISPDGFNLRVFGGRHDLAVWNRGMSLFETFPGGSGVLIPAGWKLVLQGHYKPGEEGGADRSRVGLRTASAAPVREFITITAENRDFVLPENAYDHRVETSITLDRGLRVESLLPRMHYLAVNLNVRATLPDGAERSILGIRFYSCDFETLYTPVEPLDLPAGTRINVTGFYENSLDNPNNPNRVMDEMGYGAAPGGEILSLTLRGTPL